MATTKSYTDLQQSRKLAEILPLESADAFYPWRELMKDYDSIYVPEEMLMSDLEEDDILAWSLAALLSVLPFPVLYMEMVGGMILWCCECHFIETDEVVKIEHYENPVDACYEMVIRLNKLNLL